MADNRMAYSVLTVALLLQGCRQLDSESGWVVDEDPLVTIGADLDRPGHNLVNAQGAYRANDSTIVVIDAGTSTVLFYDMRGEYTRSTGGDGRGPDQLRRVAAITMGARDTLLIRTLDPAIALVGTREKRILGKLPLAPTSPTFECRTISGSQLLPDMRILYRTYGTGRVGDCHPEGAPSTALVVAVNPTTGIVDTLESFPIERPQGSGWVPFGRSVTVAASGDRIFMGDTGSDSVRVLGRFGGVEHVWHVDLERKNIPDAVRVRESSSGVYPQQYPRYGRLVPDATGNLWMQAYPALTDPTLAWQLEVASPENVFSELAVAPGGDLWLVLDREGSEVARVRTPTGLWVYDIGEDYVIGVRRDWQNRQIVQLHALRRSS